MTHMVGRSDWRDIFDVIIVNAKKPLANAFLEEALAMLGDAMPTTLVAAAMATVTRTMAKDPTFKGTR